MNKVLFKVGRNYMFFNKGDINFIKADRNYVRLYCDDKCFVLRKTLRALEEKLDPEKFLRINRSTIVNVDKIDQLKEVDNNNYCVVLNNNEVLPWGRRYREKLVKLIKL